MRSCSCREFGIFVSDDSLRRGGEVFAVASLGGASGSVTMRIDGWNLFF